MNYVSLYITINNCANEDRIETGVTYENVVMIPMGGVTFLGHALTIKDYNYDCMLGGIMLSVKAEMLVSDADFIQIKEILEKRADTFWEDVPENIIKKSGETIH